MQLVDAEKKSNDLPNETCSFVCTEGLSVCQRFR
jgi:hypothetical protein